MSAVGDKIGGEIIALGVDIVSMRLDGCAAEAHMRLPASTIRKVRIGDQLGDV